MLCTRAGEMSKKCDAGLEPQVEKCESPARDTHPPRPPPPTQFGICLPDFGINMTSPVNWTLDMRSTLESGKKISDPRRDQAKKKNEKREAAGRGSSHCGSLPANQPREPCDVVLCCQTRPVGVLQIQPESNHQPVFTRHFVCVCACVCAWARGVCAACARSVSLFKEQPCLDCDVSSLMTHTCGQTVGSPNTTRRLSWEANSEDFERPPESRTSTLASQLSCVRHNKLSTGFAEKRGTT